MARERRATVVLEAEPQPEPARLTVRDDTPFRIAILADFRGAANDGDAPSFAPVRIDRDDYDAVLARTAPAVRVDAAAGSGSFVVGFDELDDFHPDRLYGRLAIFHALRELRHQLGDPTTFDEAARKLLGDAPEAEQASDEDAPADRPIPRSGSLLDQMVEAVAGPAPPGSVPHRPAPTHDELQAFIRSAMAPHLVPGEDPRKAGLTERVDRALTDVMRQVLHDRAFARLEAAWRAVFLLVRRVETGPDLQVFLIHAPRADVEADLDGRAIEQTALHRVLVDHATGTAGGVPWSLIVGDYTFGPSPADVGLLERIADLAKRAGAPFLAAADPALAGCPGFDSAVEPEDWARPDHREWEAFRRTELARWTGLALPRFLLRLPYGREGEETDTFAFEEMTTPPAHADYLWGNAGFACAMLIAESFAQAGWGMRPGMHQDIGGLPLHIFRHEGEANAKPCAEALMTERAAERLTDAGLMTLASMKATDRVRLVRFQSVASPAAALAGRWHSRH